MPIRTVDMHLRGIDSKFGARDRMSAVQNARELDGSQASARKLIN